MHACVVIACLFLSAPVNGSLMLSPAPSPALTVGTTTTYQCDTGYVLVGDLIRTCVDSGTGTLGSWTGSGLDPTCEYIHVCIIVYTIMYYRH